MLITTEEISKITGAPLKNVQKYYPLIIEELKRRGKNTLAFQVAILATIGVEQGSFKPTTEWYPPSWSQGRAQKYFNDAYSNRKDLGNSGGNSGWTFRGRGFIQLTGASNYRKYGQKIGADLISNPDLALEPKNAVSLLVEYCVDHGLDVWAARAYNLQGDPIKEEEAWRKIRRLVNGGYHGWEKFRKYVTAFQEAGTKDGTNV